MIKQMRPTQKYLDSPKLKAFADNNFKIGTKETEFSNNDENFVGKGEICSLFLLLLHCFYKFPISVL